MMPSLRRYKKPLISLAQTTGTEKSEGNVPAGCYGNGTNGWALFQFRNAKTFASPQAFANYAALDNPGFKSPADVETQLN
jgi:hypothetical protein